MPTYVALLRGINVGGHNRVRMADLRALLEGLGYADVRTLLQSGNAVFTAPTRSAASVSGAVATAIRAELDMDVDVVVRTGSELAAVLAHDPFDGRATDDSRYLVAFLEKGPPASWLSNIDRESYAPEEVAVVARHIYLWLPHGVQDSRLARTVTDKKLGGTSTMRNRRTVEKLAEMAGA